MKGLKNSITDVAGVTVGHRTIQRGTFQTGVTAIFPHQGNLFQEKLVAAVYVANGFGKSVGLVQVEELGTLETPLVLTNTFGVGTASNALIRHALKENSAIGEATGTVNPLVFECNDSRINDLRGMVVTEADVEAALGCAAADFAQGAVGAGTGMCCYDLKGGIGSASRVLQINGETYTLGCLVLTNYGRLEDLQIKGYPVGREIAAFYSSEAQVEQGSVIVILATDLPLSSRQLKRICKRASVGITRTGAFIGNGSGEITLAFSTAQKIQHAAQEVTLTYRCLNENYIDEVFHSVAEVVDEAVLYSLIESQSQPLRAGGVARNVLECLTALQQDDFSERRQEILAYLLGLKA